MRDEDAITDGVSTERDGNVGGSATAFRTVGLFARNYRWVICGILLLGVTKNYMDRGVLGVLNITLQHTFGWSEVDYSNLVVVFQAAYAVGLLFTGRIIDRLETRLGY